MFKNILKTVATIALYELVKKLVSRALDNNNQIMQGPPGPRGPKGDKGDPADIFHIFDHINLEDIY